MFSDNDFTYPSFDDKVFLVKFLVGTSIVSKFSLRQSWNFVLEGLRYDNFCACYHFPKAPPCLIDTGYPTAALLGVVLEMLKAGILT